MWKRIKLIFKSIKDYFINMIKNAFNHIQNGIKQLGWFVIPTAMIAFYVLLMLPQLAVFAVIASFTSGIQDPILKFSSGLLVFAAMEFILLSIAWMVVILLGLPEMFRFACYIQGSYKKRLAEEEIREGENSPLTLCDTYHRLKDHNIHEPQSI